MDTTTTNHMIWNSASSQHRKKTKLPFIWNNQKRKNSPDKLHKTTVSRTQYTRQQMTAIPERWETNEGSPNIAPRFSPWEGIQSMAQGGETEWEPRDSPESRRQELRLEELEPTGQKYTKREPWRSAANALKYSAEWVPGKCKWQAMERSIQKD